VVRREIDDGTARASQAWVRMTAAAKPLARRGVDAPRHANRKRYVGAQSRRDGRGEAGGIASRSLASSRLSA
jgi:hypothetical protein